jgi:D-serine deaminase-like pyridoxal phosphate-dependent protein
MMNCLVGRRKAELDTPTLCIDVDLMERNLARMASFFASRSAKLRPHIKTHKSVEIAHRQLAAGAIGITCAKLGEAEAMAGGRVDDILIANQIIGKNKMSRLMELTSKCSVKVAVDSAENIAALEQAARSRGVRLSILVEVDIGMGRCGVQPGEQALCLAQQVVNSRFLNFDGLMGYEGHTVMIPDRGERKRQTEFSLSLLLETKSQIELRGIPVGIVSSGGTGTYDITGIYPGVTEVQAGSYVTMDTQYRDIVGVDFECALFVLAQVISLPRPGRAVIDAGLKTMTRDFGLPIVAHPDGWRLISLSEEHAVLQHEGGPHLRMGQQVEIWPNHGCTTVNLHDQFVALRDDMVEDVWPIDGRGKVQ